MKNLPKIQLTEFYHNGYDQIGIKFYYNAHLKDLAKSIKNCWWSSTHKSWYVKRSNTNLSIIRKKFKGHAIIDESGLHPEYKLEQRQAYNKTERQLNESQKLLLNNFYRYLRGKRYSKSTISTYIFYLADFIAFHSKKELSELSNRDVELFIETIFIKRQYSISSQRQFISALKVFITFEPGTEIESLELVRPHKSLKLPIVLSLNEVVAIIRATKNLKHRAVIALLYSCGLRISEALNLKISDIDIDRGQVYVRNSKGRKDRYVGLAKSFLPLLSNYLMTYQPKQYFVEGLNHTKYSPQSVRHFLKKSCRASGIVKKVTPHTLRHSYATHLLESGVDIRYIQSLLGHSRPETTMIYTHVKRTDLLEIENPLDIAVRSITFTDKGHKKVALSGEIIR